MYTKALTLYNMIEQHVATVQSLPPKHVRCRSAAHNQLAVDGHARAAPSTRVSRKVLAFLESKLQREVRKRFSIMGGVHDPAASVKHTFRLAIAFRCAAYQCQCLSVPPKSSACRSTFHGRSCWVVLPHVCRGFFVAEFHYC